MIDRTLFKYRGVKVLLPEFFSIRRAKRLFEAYGKMGSMEGKIYTCEISPQSLISEIGTTVDDVLRHLPKKTYNCEPFGLQLMIDGDGKNWTVCYYSHFKNERDSRIPVIKAETPLQALIELYKFMKERGLLELGSEIPVKVEVSGPFISREKGGKLRREGK